MISTFSDEKLVGYMFHVINNKIGNAVGKRSIWRIAVYPP
jgi:hypothetical protein